MSEDGSFTIASGNINGKDKTGAQQITCQLPRLRESRPPIPQSTDESLQESEHRRPQYGVGLVDGI